MSTFFSKRFSFRLLLATVLILGLLPLVAQLTGVLGAPARAQNAQPNGQDAAAQPKGNQGAATPQGSPSTAATGSDSCPYSSPPSTWRYYGEGISWRTGTWTPNRLALQGSDVCVQASGRIVYVEKGEYDGDIDYYIELDPAYKYLAGSSKQLNIVRTFSGISQECKQKCDMIWEAMPRDSGHLPELGPNTSVTVTGAWVTDKNHGHNELHPIFVQNGATSGPQYGGSKATDGRDAYWRCLDENNNRCVGYYVPPQ